MFNKKKILSLILCICLIFEQVGFAQVSATLDISTHLANLRANFMPPVFRPLHLRYLSYNPQDNKFQVFLDRGSLKEPNPNELQDATRDLLNYFLVGVSLPNDIFWVNLRPDAEGQIIDDRLARTDVGRIMLEADLQLKKDTARFTSPENPEGKRYWDRLYKKAGEIFGSENITIPTLTRPWIVPGEIIISETADSAYIYKATLKVMLEQDYLKDSVAYNFKDDKQKELNEYSSQLIREIIIPRLTKEINSSKRYAALRQVYYSLVMAQWFKARFSGKQGKYYDLINSQNLQNLTSKEPWSKTFYFKEYQKNFQQGEYNIQEQVYTPYGQSVRSYFSGGMKLEVEVLPLGAANVGSSPVTAIAIPSLRLPNNNSVIPMFTQITSEDRNGTGRTFLSTVPGYQKETRVSSPLADEKAGQSPYSREFHGKTLITVTGDINKTEGVHTYMFKLTNILASRHKNLTQIILYNDTYNLNIREEKSVGSGKIILIPFRKDNLNQLLREIELIYQIDTMITHIPLSEEGLIVSDFSAKRSIPLVAYVHWGDAFSGAWKRMPGLKDNEGIKSREEVLKKSLIVNKNTTILTVSEAGKDEISKVVGMPSSLIGPMVAADIFNPDLVSDKEREGLRRSCGIRDNDVVLLFPNAINYRKGPDELIEAVLANRNKQYANWLIKAIVGTKIGRRLLKTYGVGNIKVVFAGEIIDDSLFADMQRYIKENGLEDIFIFQGKVTQERLRSWYAASDIVLLPSKEEGFGLVVVEAALMEKPAIVYDIPGVNEVVVQNKTGLLVPWNNAKEVRVESLAQAMESLLDNPGKRELMGRKARKDALERFDPDKLIVGHEEMYVRAMQQKGRSFGSSPLAEEKKEPSNNSSRINESDILSAEGPSALAKSVLEKGILKKGSKVLSLGSGNLKDEELFAQNGSQVIATEHNPEILKALSERTSGVKDLVVQELDVGQPFDIQSASVDVVYARLLLHYFNNAAQRNILSEIRRVLKPGGIAVIQLKSKGDILYQQRGNVAEADGMVYFPAKNYSRNHLSRGELEDRVKGALLEIIDIYEHSERLYRDEHNSSLITALVVKKESASSPLADEKKEPPDKAGNQELSLVQERLRGWPPDYGGYTEEGRNNASLSLIEKIVEKILRGSPGLEVNVVEVGMGNNDAPTYRELRKSMLAKGVKVWGIEAFKGHIPSDLNKEVVIGTILNPQGEALKLIRNANIIRISNLVQYQLYFNIAERTKLLEVMKKEMKDGALLILTRTFKPGYEEGIMYVKKGTELILESFVFTVKMDEEGDLMAGADVIAARYDKQGLFGRLIIDPLMEELKDYKPGKEAALNSALPGLLVSKLKEKYNDDIKQLGEMVSINFEKLLELIQGSELTQGLKEKSQEEFFKEMAGLIPGYAGEAVSSPLVDEKKESHLNAYEQKLAMAQEKFRMRSVIGSITTEDRNKASLELIVEIINSGAVLKPKVVDVGLGASGYRTGAPTFRELVEALGEKAEVYGIELLPELIPDDLRNRVVVGDILNLNPQGKAVELIQNADIIRISNLVLGYFNVSERVELLRSLKTLIKKEGALLIITSSFESGSEEGFIYVKKGAELILGSFIFTVRVDESNRLSVGTNNIASRLDEGGLLKKLILDSLEADESGYLYNNQIGNKKEFNLRLPALTVEKIKERYPDFDVRQIGEMVSIGFNNLYALIQNLGEDAKKKILEKMAGLIPDATGELASSPLADGKTESYPSALGGIDFRSLPIVTQAVSNLSTNLSSSAINNLASVNLDQEWSQIERMANAGIIPSAERIKEYIQSSCTQENISRDKDKIVLCISDILRQEEERGVVTDSVLRDVLVVLESMQGTRDLREVFLAKLI